MTPQLSLLLPSKGETLALWQTMESAHVALSQAGITHEFVVVNDVKAQNEGGTGDRMRKFIDVGFDVQYLERLPPATGFGSAVKLGLEKFRGPAVMILMSDGSEDPEDVIRFYRKFVEGYDCVFGDRFCAGGKIIGYDAKKLRWNRLANWLLSWMFWLPYKDFTNASKLYSRKAIDGILPIFSDHFNITIELPLKAYVRGFRVAVLPNTWRSIEERESNLKLGAMGKRYAYTAWRIFWERLYG